MADPDAYDAAWYAKPWEETLAALDTEVKKEKLPLYGGLQAGLLKSAFVPEITSQPPGEWPAPLVQPVDMTATSASLVPVNSLIIGGDMATFNATTNEVIFDWARIQREAEGRDPRLKGLAHMLLAARALGWSNPV